MKALDTIIAERQATHGDYAEMAAVAGTVHDALFDALGQRGTPGQRLALGMIGVKLARIVCGDPNHHDHWRDIEGYARLASSTHPATDRAA